MQGMMHVFLVVENMHQSNFKIHLCSEDLSLYTN